MSERIDVLGVLDRMRDCITAHAIDVAQEERWHGILADYGEVRAVASELIAAARLVAEANASCPADQIIFATDGQKLDWAQEINSTLVACDKLDEALARIGDTP